MRSLTFRQVSLCLAMVFVVGLGAVILLPWWLAPVLRRVGSHWGAGFVSYERNGYFHFVLHDLDLQMPGLHVVVDRLEAPTPVLWLWLRATGRPEQILAGAWRVDVRDSESPASASAPASGWLPLRRILLNVGLGLDTWLARARLGAGEVTWPGGGLSMASATWTPKGLQVEGLDFGVFHGALQLRTSRAENRLWLTLRTKDGSVFGELESGEKTVQGDCVWWGQNLDLEAKFAETGWLPESGALVAKAWELPAAVLKLGAHFEVVQAHGRVDWHQGSYETELELVAVPLRKSRVPSFGVTLRGSGTPRSLTLVQAHVVAPGINMDLSEPVTVDREGRLAAGEARLTFVANLEEQPWLDARGVITGVASVHASKRGGASMDFSLVVRDLLCGRVAVQSLDVKGLMEWPTLVIASAVLQPSTGDLIEGAGAYDFARREFLDVRLGGEVKGPTLAAWLPVGVTLASLRFSAAGNGAGNGFLHTGWAQADSVQTAGLHPLGVELHWTGRASCIETFTTTIAAGSTRISSTGGLAESELILRSLALRVGDVECLHLIGQATVNWRQDLECRGLQLGGLGQVQLSLKLAEKGSLEVSMERISSSWFKELILWSGASWELEKLGFKGAWEAGPLDFSLSTAGRLDSGAGAFTSLDLVALGDKDGVHVKSLEAREAARLVFSAKGLLPLVLYPTRTPVYAFLPEGPVLVDMKAGVSASFWKNVGRLCGLELSDPRLSAHIEGTWAHPLGDLRLEVEEVSLNTAPFAESFPSLKELELVLKGTRGELCLEKLSATVEGQLVKAQGRLPWGERSWKDIWAAPLEFVRQSAEWRLEIPSINVSAFARYLPQYVAPKGSLSLKVDSQAGVMKGDLVLHDAASRAFGAVGVLQDINAELHLKGRRLELSGANAKLGGQVLTLAGTVDIPSEGDPRYALSLNGENVPFVRQAGLLVRGNVALALQSTDSGSTTLQGNVTMCDSLLLSDLKSLFPHNRPGPSQQPPYFGVSMEPFKAWHLAVSLSGRHFMRVRTPVFRGVASMQFQLGGTLGEPILVGEATLDEGVVLMPFASFTVVESHARITEAKPHELGVFVRAVGRRYNYGVSMELKGSAGDPRVSFTSSPPLESDQLLLMVMTGVPPVTENVFSSTQRFARIGTYLGQGFLGSIGVDDASADRISISSGEKVSRQGRETYEVDYKLNARWKWVGEYDEFDDYNLGLKWRLYPAASTAEKAADVSK